MLVRGVAAQTGSNLVLKPLSVKAERALRRTRPN
jgi:hypothetical protein